jgi:membrane protease YdiL (CAAX protease family)
MEEPRRMIFEAVFIFLLIFFPVWHISKKKGIKVNRETIKEIEKELGFNWLGFGATSKKSFFLLVLLVVLAIGFGYAVSALGISDIQKVYESIRLKNPLILLYSLTIGVTAEEIFFRGFLVKKFGVLFASFLFAAAHVLYFSIGEILGAFLLGWLLSWAFVRNKTLWPNIFAHMAYNFIALMLYM